MNISELKKIAARKHQNEYVCHIYFVYKIAMDLQKKYGGDKKIIIAASFLHDIGRGLKDRRGHSVAGAEIAVRKLKNKGYTEKELKAVYNCIISHNRGGPKPKTIEEKIIRSADGAAKVLYAPLFGLLSNKKPYEKPAWVLKHIEKGCGKICIPDFKRVIKSQYLQMKKIYKESVEIN